MEIAGFNLTNKTPGFKAEVVNPAGSISVGSQPLYLVLIGGKAGTSGTATEDVDVVDIGSSNDADAYFGAGSELACMCYAALLYSGLKIKAIAVAEGASPAGATATLTVGGTWNTAGSFKLHFGGGAAKAGGATVVIDVSASATTTSVAAAAAAAVQAVSQLFCSGASALAVATFTTKTRATTSNQWAVYIDKTNAPSGMTLTLAGGTALTAGPSQTGCRFTGGAGTRSVANVLAVLDVGEYDKFCFADNDVTNAALVKAAIASRAAIGKQRYTDYVYGSNASYGTAQTLAASTLNDVRGHVTWQNECESAGFILGASQAAQYQEKDNTHPNRSFNGAALRGVAPHRFQSQRSTPTVIETALNNGVTPTDTQPDGTVVVVRGIGTHCLSGTAADARCIDHGHGKTPDRFSQRLNLIWTTEVLPACEYVVPDPAEGDPPPDESEGGKIWPAKWRQRILQEAKAAEKENWIHQVDANASKCIVEFRTVPKDLIGQFALEPTPIAGAAGLSIRNVTAA